jgi:transposase
MRKCYESDISQERFKEIEALLRGVLYLLRTGCQWRFLPRKFSKWQTVYAWFAKWSQPDEQGISLLEHALKNQVGAARTRHSSPFVHLVFLALLPGRS